tara:strand:+ start:2190 stop:2777 length:588 start_codon:yes stop_codon:yes gene_type:complete
MKKSDIKKGQIVTISANLASQLRTSITSSTKFTIVMVFDKIRIHVPINGRDVILDVSPLSLTLVSEPLTVKEKIIKTNEEALKGLKQQLELNRKSIIRITADLENKEENRIKLLTNASKLQKKLTDLKKPSYNKDSYVSRKDSDTIYKVVSDSSAEELLVINVIKPSSQFYVRKTEMKKVTKTQAEQILLKSFAL